MSLKSNLKEKKRYYVQLKCKSSKKSMSLSLSLLLEAHGVRDCTQSVLHRFLSIATCGTDGVQLALQSPSWLLETLGRRLNQSQLLNLAPRRSQKNWVALSFARNSCSGLVWKIFWCAVSLREMSGCAKSGGREVRGKCPSPDRTKPNIHSLGYCFFIQ